MGSPRTVIATPLRNSYWVLPGKVLAGEHPGGTNVESTRERLRRLLDAGVECFIDLTEPGEIKPYDSELPVGIEYLRKPIKDHGTPAQRVHMAEILDCLHDTLLSGRCVYVHCRAGIGRTGTVVGCFLVERGLPGEAALDELNRLWQQCDRSQSWASVPETDDQVEFVRRWKARGIFDDRGQLTAPTLTADDDEPTVDAGAPWAHLLVDPQNPGKSTSSGPANRGPDLARKSASGSPSVAPSRPAARPPGAVRSSAPSTGARATGAPASRAPASRALPSRVPASGGPSADAADPASRRAGAAGTPTSPTWPAAPTAGKGSTHPTGPTHSGGASPASDQSATVGKPSATSAPAGVFLPGPANAAVPSNAPAAVDAPGATNALSPASAPGSAHSSALTNSPGAANAPGAANVPNSAHAPGSVNTPGSANILTDPTSVANVGRGDARPPAMPTAPPRGMLDDDESDDSDPLLQPEALAAASNLRARFHGALLGLAVGDAVAAATQYRRPGSFTPVGDMLGGGPFDLPRGGWSDDTAMALCLADSLLERDGFDARDQMDRYRRWQQEGYLSATGQCVGITASSARAIAMAQWRRQAFSGSHDPSQLDPEPLSRVAAVVLFYFATQGQAIDHATEAARATCQAPAVLEACRSLARALHAALEGQPKAVVLQLAALAPGALPAGETNGGLGSQGLAASEAALASHGAASRSGTPTLTAASTQDAAAFARRGAPAQDAAAAPSLSAAAGGTASSAAARPGEPVRGSSTAPAVLAAAVKAFGATDNFRDAILYAANLGGDSDVVAAVCGQLAGAYYGVRAIPTSWHNGLIRKELILSYADRLLARAMVGMAD